MNPSQMIAEIEDRVKKLNASLDKADSYQEIAKIMALIRRYHYTLEIINELK